MMFDRLFEPCREVRTIRFSVLALCDGFQFGNLELEEINMPFVSVSHWTATEITDETVKTASERFLPVILEAGATAVQMVKTGDLSMCVVTQYPDAATAQAAQAKITELRAEVARDFPMTLASAHAGEVVGSA